MSGGISRAFVQKNVRQNEAAFKTADATLAVYEQHVECNPTDADIDITLPDAGSAADRFYYIVLGSDATQDVEIYEPGNSTALIASGNELQTAGDYALLYSTGFAWVVVCKNIDSTYS